MKEIIIGLLLLVTIKNINAQTEKFKENGTWFTFVNKIIISEKINLVNVVQQRRVGFMSETQAFLFSPSINYKIAKNISIGTGYLHFKSFPNGVLHAVIPKNEYRYFEQIMLNSKVVNLNVSQRLRFEERFIDLINLNVLRNAVNGKKYVNRITYKLQVKFNLFRLKNRKFIIGKLMDDFRIKSSNGLAEPDFDQNIFEAFFGYKYLKNNMIWIGYGRINMKKSHTKYITNNFLNVLYCYNFDLRKKK